MTDSAPQLALLCAAFWTAVLRYRGERPERFVVGIVLGAAAGHLGWAALHAPEVRAHPWALLDPAVGFCVLFVPLGLLLCERSAAAFRTLLLALAVARLGCVAGGCCHGTPTALPWALGGLHPTPLYEIAGLLMLHAASRGVSDGRVVPWVLGGLGFVRLAVGPLRAAPPLGEPMIPAAWIAGAWVALALTCVAWRPGRAIALRR
jgi:prolipoprotein diacylglyceryltransferase